MRFQLALGALAVCVAALGSAGCGEGRDYVSIGTAPVGGTFYQVGGAIAEVLNAQRGEREWSVTAESTGGSMENIRLLGQGSFELAISNSSITYFAVRGEEGWEREYPVRTVATLFPNIAMFIAPRSSGITSVADLRGERVYVGPEGAGFEYFIRPILRAHGLSLDDLNPVYGSQQSAVDYLGDGAVAAAFLGGGVPTASIVQASQSMDILLIPYEEEAKRTLIDQYAFFERATIPAGTYSGQEEPYEGLNVGSAHLITADDVDEELVYAVARILFEHREDVAQRHAAARGITPEGIVRDTGTPFHPGAIRYYREAGLWPDETVAAE